MIVVMALILLRVGWKRRGCYPFPALPSSSFGFIILYGETRWFYFTPVVLLK
jgi:hypothetical protein